MLFHIFGPWNDREYCPSLDDLLKGEYDSYVYDVFRDYTACDLI